MAYEGINITPGTGETVVVDNIVGIGKIQVMKVDLGTDGATAPLVGTDVDTGAGTDVAMPVALRFPASGGGVSAPGDAANGMDVDVTRLPALTMAANAQSDGHSVTLGFTTDTEVLGDVAGTVSAKLRGLSHILNNVWFAASTCLRVATVNIVAISSALNSQVDGHSATLGITTDTEATGNGSMIALLKRIRTMLAGPLPVSQNGSWSVGVSDASDGTAQTVRSKNGIGQAAVFDPGVEYVLGEILEQLITLNETLSNR